MSDLNKYGQCPHESHSYQCCGCPPRESRIAELEAELQALREALTPSAETKARYWGSDDLPMMNWGDIKLLMQTIRERAGAKLQEDKADE